MHLLFDIFQGIGIAAAVGIRPFLPVLAVGAFASADIQIDFKGTSFSFLQGTPWLLIMVACAIVLAVAERRLRALNDSDSGQSDESRRGLRRVTGEWPPAVIVLAGVALALAALLFAGALARSHHASWPGYPAGVVCALISLAALRPLFARARARLDASASGAVSLYAEGIAVALAILSVVAPPIGVIALLALLWMLAAGWRRRGEKYAGLRILR
jgi:Domain of unknown function (DUF4126)